MSQFTNPISLDQTFRHQSSTHKFTIKWRSLGNPSHPPLIFIHGTPWSSQVWTPYALSLSRQFHVHLFDRAGFGDSPAEEKLPGASTTTSNITEYDSDLARQSEAFAALFQSWIPSWNGQKPHVIAHDNAGLISLRAHLLHECDYASLCLIDVVAIGPFGKSLFKAVAENPSYFLALPDMAIDGILESYIRNAAHFDLSQTDIRALKAPWLREGGNVRFVRELCQANYRNTDAVEPKYGEVGTKMPVKVIWGADDKWIPAADAFRLGKSLNAKDVVVIENAGHLIMYDQGAQLGVEMALWLSKASDAK